jgi:hypothetical protein
MTETVGHILEMSETALLRSVVSLILDGTTCNLMTSEYYKKMVNDMKENDDHLIQKFIEFIKHVRETYKSSQQYFSEIEIISMKKHPDDGMKELLDNDCSLCLKPLLDGRKLSRIRPCGHCFHETCCALYELHCCATTPLEQQQQQQRSDDDENESTAPDQYQTRISRRSNISAGSQSTLTTQPRMKCPLCRGAVALPIQFYHDHENSKPRF